MRCTFNAPQRKRHDLWNYLSCRPILGVHFCVSPRDRIPHGDYRRHLLETINEEQWLIAYGSNISSVRMIERVGEIAACKKGCFHGYELVFNKKTYRHESVRANIRYNETSHCPVWSLGGCLGYSLRGWISLRVCLINTCVSLYR